jgi:hypothetical protein
VRDREDVRIDGPFDPNGHPGPVASSAIRLEELAGDLGGAASIIESVDLEDSHREMTLSSRCRCGR